MTREIIYNAEDNPDYLQIILQSFPNLNNEQYRDVFVNFEIGDEKYIEVESFTNHNFDGRNFGKIFLPVLAGLALNNNYDLVKIEAHFQGRIYWPLVGARLDPEHIVHLAAAFTRNGLDITGYSLDDGRVDHLLKKKALRKIAKSVFETFTSIPMHFNREDLQGLAGSVPGVTPA